MNDQSPSPSNLSATSPARVIKIVLADDHDILRQGLKLLFRSQADIQVVGEARTGKDAIDLVARLQPDVAVLDITMAEMDGLEACRRIRAHTPDTQVLILTMHESEEYFLQALRMGAAGYLVKKAAPADLSNAIRTIAHGGAYLYPGLARALVRAYVDRPGIQPQPVVSPVPVARATRSIQQRSPLDVLTPRELEVLKLVAEGCTNQQIADQLVLSIKTVQAHRANVMEKLGLNNVTHLVRFAIHHGLVPPEL